MRIYTVHAPLNGTAQPKTQPKMQPMAESVVFVRDGFQLAAAVFGVLWFIANRLWLIAVGYAVAMVALLAVLGALHLNSGSIFAVLILVALLTGFEAGSLRRWALSRGQWREVDVVVGRTREDAERRFFDRWVNHQLPSHETSVDPGAPPPVRPYAPVGQGASSQAGHNDVIGLFPQPGAPR